MKNPNRQNQYSPKTNLHQLAGNSNISLFTPSNVSESKNDFIPFKSNNKTFNQSRTSQPDSLLSISFSDRKSSINPNNFETASFLKKDKSVNLTKMCSDEEIEKRTEFKKISIFEADPKLSNFNSQTNRWEVVAEPNFCIKCYTRPDAGSNLNVQENIRSPKVFR